VNVVVEILGAFAAAVGIRVVATHLSWRAALGTVAAVLGLVAIVSQGWSLGRCVLTQRPNDAKIPPAERRAGVGARFGANEGVLRTADEQIPRRASVLLICPNCSVELGQWITYRLTPRAFADRPDQAEWIFTYDAKPSQGKVRTSDLTDVREISPGFTIARLK
jgi:hypothetical protein